MTSDCTLQVRSLTEFLAAVPYLLGFHPADSLVIVAFRDQRMMFATRHDLPGPGADPDEARAVAARTAEIVVRQGVERVTIIGYGEAARVTPAVLRAAEALRRRHMPVVDELRVTDGRYWSYRCTDLSCCPVEGTPCRPESTSIAAQATYQGQVVLPDREALVAGLAPVEGDERTAMTAATARAQAKLAALLAREMRDDGSARLVRRAGRAAVRDAERCYRSGRRLADDEAAWLGVLLVDVEVRDYAWERTAGEHWRIDLWTDVLRRVEPLYVPAPAGLLGFAAWRQGNGALAVAAVDRALQAEPHYPMGRLLAQVLGEGVSPAIVDGWPLVDRLELSGPRRNPVRVPRRTRRRGSRSRVPGGPV